MYLKHYRIFLTAEKSLLDLNAFVSFQQQNFKFYFFC